MRIEFGLIGKSLGHSFSSEYHNSRFKLEGIDAHYSNYELEDPSEIKDLIAGHPSLIGLNVTLPFKESVIPFLDVLSDEAQLAGAVNTIVVKPNQLVGYNTDVSGFKQSLRNWIDPEVRRALILGSGGASRAVAVVLTSLNIDYLVVSRTLGMNKISYPEIDDMVMQNHNLIVNTTPLGMNPYISGMPPIPYDKITSRHWVYDLVYNPEKTILLARSEQFGAHIKNGLQMLHLQADMSWNIWKLYLEQKYGRAND